MKLINPDNSINPHEYFTFESGKNKGKRLQISASTSTGYKVIESLESIKNLETGKVIELERKKLKELNPIIIEI